MSRRKRARARLGGALSLAALLVPTTAWAHGGLWRANRILIAPDDPDHIVLQSDLRGPIFTKDGGKTWHWICAETYGRSSISAAPVSMLLRPGGRMLVASYGRGLLVSEGNPCTFTPPSGLALGSARDVTAVGDTLVALGSQETEEAVRDVLFVSRDEGRQFEPLGSPLPADFTATSLRGASEGRLYVAGLRETGWAVARSDDRGASIRFGAVVPFQSKVGWAATIVALGRDTPDLLFVLQDEFEWNLDAPSGDRLYVSEDGGAHFRVLFEDGRPLRGFASSPDGSTLLLGGESGLYRAALTAALARGQEAFEQLANVPFFGLRWTEAGVYAGMEEFSSERDDAFSLGVSVDRGTTFTRRMSVCDTKAYACAADTRGGELCPGIFSDGNLSGGGFKEDFLDSGRCTTAQTASPRTPIAMSEAGPRIVESDPRATHSSPDQRPSTSGCGLASEPSPTSHSATGLLLTLAALAGRLRRPKRKVC